VTKQKWKYKKRTQDKRLNIIKARSLIPTKRYVHWDDHKTYK